MLYSKIKSIIIKNFRNHEQILIDLNDFDENIIGLIDNNGSGKTSILEAISLLSPGFGIRGGQFLDMVKKNSESEDFLISINLQTGDDLMNKIDIIYKNGKKKISINDKTISTQGELKCVVGMIWLTPEIQLEIAINKPGRRKFFDRMVFNFHQNHAKLLIDYEALIKERAKVLEMSENFEKNSWLDSIEKQLCTLSINISKNRIQFLSEIKNNSKELNMEVEFDVKCDVCDIIEKEKDLADAFILQEFLKSRKRDKFSYRTNFGVHRYDFLIKYKKNGYLIDLCSSGERKYAVTCFLLCVAKGIISYTNHAPIVLIDEFSSFIDSSFKEILIKKLVELNCQIWLTGVEIPQIDYKMKIFSVKDLIVK